MPTVIKPTLPQIFNERIFPSGHQLMIWLLSWERDPVQKVMILNLGVRSRTFLITLGSCTCTIPRIRKLANYQWRLCIRAGFNGLPTENSLPLQENIKAYPAFG